MREEAAKAIVCPQCRTTHATLLGGRHSRQIENLRGILDLNRFLRVLRSRTSKLFRHGRSVSGLACTVCCERHCTGIVLALYGARPTALHSRRDSDPAGFTRISYRTGPFNCCMPFKRVQICGGVWGEGHGRSVNGRCGRGPTCSAPRH